MPPSMQVELTCIIAGVLIAVFNPLGRVPAAGRGSSFKGAQQDGRLGTRQAVVYDVGYGIDPAYWKGYLENLAVNSLMNRSHQRPLGELYTRQYARIPR